MADDSLTEKYTLACKADSPQSDRTLVHFFPAMDEPLHWSVAATAESSHPASRVSPVVRRLSADEQAALGISAGGELWEVSRPESLASAFTLEATRTVSLGKAVSVPLAELPQASSQTGSVTIRSTAAHVPEVENRRLKPAALPAPAVGRWQEAIAAYRYAPQEEAVLAAIDPSAHLSVGPGTAQPAAWVWSAGLDSHYFADGKSEHVAICRLENTGRRFLTIDKPATAELHAVWIDGAIAKVSAKTESATKLAIELPVGRRFPVVVLEWSCTEPKLGLLSTREAVWPSFDMPVLSRRLNVWLPPRYTLTAADGLTGPIAGDSWSQRLFGPFGRPTGEPPFDLVHGEQWAGAFSRLLHRDLAWRRAEVIVEAANKKWGQDSSSTASAEVTWGELLTQVQAELAGQAGEPPLFIDSRALADIGVFPRAAIGTPLPAADRTPLADENLVLLVASRAILLTTGSAAAPWREGLAVSGIAPRARAVERLTSDRLADELSKAATGLSSRFVPAECWAIPDLKLPWAGTPGESKIPDHAGWTSIAIDASGEGRQTLQLISEDAIRASASALFVLAAIVFWRACGFLRGQTLVRFLAAAAVVALWIPGYLTPLGAGVWLGGIAGCCLRRVLPVATNHGKHGHAESRSASSKRRLVTAGLTTVALVLLLVRVGRAAEPVTNAPKPAEPIYEVLVPIDANQRITGHQVFVPEPLYRELSRRPAASGPATTSNWLLTSALYQGGLSNKADQLGLGKADWIARYELEVLSPNSRVRIPFGGDGTNLLPDGVRLDGRPIEFQKLDGPPGLALTVADVGRHQLELTFRPTPRTSASAAEIELSIPSVPDARVEFENPDGVHVAFPAVRGTLAAESKLAKISGSLGPIDRLAVRWGLNDEREATPVLADADELLWFKVHPGSVVVEARFKVRVARGNLRQLQIQVDPRLRQLPLERNSPIAEIRTEAGEAPMMYLGLAKPAAEQVAFKLSFLLADSSGIGNLQLPRLELLAAKSVNRQLALSVDAPWSTTRRRAVCQRQFRKRNSPRCGVRPMACRRPPGS